MLNLPRMCASRGRFHKVATIPTTSTCLSVLEKEWFHFKLAMLVPSFLSPSGGDFKKNS